MEKLIIGDELGRALSQELNLPFISIEDRVFADGEIQPRLEKEEKAQEAILIIQKKQKENINAYLVKYLLLLRKIKELAEKTIAIMPYLPYARQDSVFREGEPLSSLYIAELIEKNADIFITCNMHEHRKKIGDLFKIPAYNIFVFEDMAEKFKDFSPSDSVVIGPDEEAKAFIDNFCKNFPASKIILQKNRDFKTGKVSFTYPKDVEEKIKNKDVIIVDDIISTGNTILETAQIIKQLQAKTISFVFVHSIFGDAAIDQLAIVNPKKIIFTNTLENSHHTIDIVKPLARNLLEKRII
jgi:ribose-phosphate pyrophosphokinase